MDANFQKYVTSNALDLTILPTEQCNFRCIYCYEDFKSGKMSRAVVKGIKNLLSFRAPELEHLTISWFGGEPILADDVIKEIMNFIKCSIPKKQNSVISSGMTTNASLLTLQKLNELVELGVNQFQITFDGDKEQHDKLRVTTAKSGTFDLIWKNVMAAHDSNLGFKITLRLHVNKNNIESLKDLLTKLSREIGTDQRFEIFIRELSMLGGERDRILPLLRENKGSALEELKDYARALGLHLCKEKGGECGYVCYATKLNAFVIRANGSVAKCTTALNDDKNNVGRLMDDGTMQLDKDKLIWWARGLFSADRTQLECPRTASA